MSMDLSQVSLTKSRQVVKLVTLFSSQLTLTVSEDKGDSFLKIRIDTELKNQRIVI